MTSTKSHLRGVCDGAPAVEPAHEQWSVPSASPPQPAPGTAVVLRAGHTSAVVNRREQRLQDAAVGVHGLDVLTGQARARIKHNMISLDSLRSLPQRHYWFGAFAHPNVLAYSTTSVVQRQYMQPQNSLKNSCSYGIVWKHRHAVVIRAQHVPIQH
jgi:hypothetical protein